MSIHSHTNAPHAALPESPVTDGTLSRAVAIFSAMGDPTRLRLLEALSQGERCVCDLAADSGVSQSAISHQLRLLRDRGLVTFTRDGNRAIYRLADDHVRSLLAQGFAHAEEGKS